MLETIVYVSAAANADMSASALEALLKRARRNNRANGVTGVLFFADGNFIQALEGPKQAVEETFARISRDPRHYQILELYRAPIEERNFPDWSMGSRKLRAGEMPEGAFDLSMAALEKIRREGRGEEVFVLLSSFYKSVYRNESEDQLSA